jgi:hypothetical protein
MPDAWRSAEAHHRPRHTADPAVMVAPAASPAGAIPMLAKGDSIPPASRRSLLRPDALSLLGRIGRTDARCAGGTNRLRLDRAGRGRPVRRLSTQDGNDRDRVDLPRPLTPEYVEPSFLHPRSLEQQLDRLRLDVANDPVSATGRRGDAPRYWTPFFHPIPEATAGHRSSPFQSKMLYVFSDSTVMLMVSWSQE